MKSIKSKLLLTASILVCLTGLTLAQDHQIPTREIIFETSDQQEDWQQSWEGMGVIRPKFAAKLTVRRDRNFTNLDSRMFADVVSEQQQAFIKQGRFYNYDYYDNVGLYRYYLLYAVTAEDARNMAQRYIEYHDQQANSRLQELKDNFAQNEKIIYDAEKRLPQLEAELEPLEEIVKALGVRYNDKHGLAEERRTEFYKMLSFLKIDIAGYQAKVEVLRSYLEKIPTRDNPTYESTRQMLIEQEAELAGILGRKKEIESQIAHINEFTQAYSKRSSLLNERFRLNNNMDRAQDRIKESEQTFANLPAELTPIELLENKVIIYPVREK